jgi:hypothetical protein
MFMNKSYRDAVSKIEERPLGSRITCGFAFGCTTIISGGPFGPLMYIFQSKKKVILLTPRNMNRDSCKKLTE